MSPTSTKPESSLSSRPSDASRTLWALSEEARFIEGELAIALAMASSDDPEEVACGEELINELMSAANDNQAALVAKADAICTVVEGLRLKAASLKEIAVSRLERAKAEERAADNLQRYLVKALTGQNPGSKKFRFEEHDLVRFDSSSVHVDPDVELSDIPDEFVREKVVTERSLDKNKIKQAIKAGAKIPGVQIVQTSSWKIK